MLKRCCGSVNSKLNLSVTILTFNKIQGSCSFGRHVGGQIVPSNMAANTNHTTLLKKLNCHNISPLNGFALKFGMQDNFGVLGQFLASEGFQLIV